MIYTLNETQQICVFYYQFNSDCKSLILRRSTSFVFSSWSLEIMRMYVNDRPRILFTKGTKSRLLAGALIFIPRLKLYVMPVL
jgi:hypothetical protein